MKNVKMPTAIRINSVMKYDKMEDSVTEEEKEKMRRKPYSIKGVKKVCKKDWTE